MKAIYTIIVTFLYCFALQLVDAEEGFSFNLNTHLSQVHLDSPVISSSTFYGLRYQPYLDLVLISGKSIPDTTAIKHVSVIISKVFDKEAIKTPQLSDDSGIDTSMCTVVQCDETLGQDAICINYVFGTENQEMLNTHTKLTLPCNISLISIETTPQSALNAVIYSSDGEANTEIFTSTPNTSAPTLFTTPITPPTFTHTPTRIIPNIDFSYTISFTIPATGTGSFDQSFEDLLFVLYPNYSTPLSLTTCRAKNQQGDYISVGVLYTTDIPSIYITLDASLLIKTDQNDPNSPFRCDLQCVLHSPTEGTYSSGGSMVVYQIDGDNQGGGSEVVRTNLLFAWQMELPDITSQNNGLKLDFKLNQFNRYFLNQKQIDTLIKGVEKFLTLSASIPVTPSAFATPFIPPMRVTQTDPGGTDGTFTGLVCNLIQLTREYHHEYPYPGAKPGYWEIPTLSLYCHGSNGQNIQRDTLESVIVNTFSLREVLQSSLLWDISGYNTNIILPSPSNVDDDGGDDDGDNTDGNPEPADQVEDGGDDSEAPKGPVRLPDGTIYDNTEYNSKHSSLHLYRIGFYELPGHCFNGDFDGDTGELDIDCGGAGCPLCGHGLKCNVGDKDGDDPNGGCVFLCLDGVCSESGVGRIGVFGIFVAVFVAVFV